ncbi:MAG: hypothetical protein H7X95_05665 [Deltaproteobacteria bacterium]|nr:hypothetical protein [Deltaproteobacteria bacterium]
MAKTTQSIQYAAQVAAGANVVNRINDGRQVSSAAQFALIKVVLDALNVATDVITLLELPGGAIVCPELSKLIVTDDATSGALTIDIGDVVDPDRYCDGANCASTGEVSFLAPAFPAGLGTRTPVVKSATASLDTSLVTMTLATFTATIEAGEIYVLLAYKCL